MWTLWLVSKVLQRLSLRSRIPAHSSPDPYISGMKYKYSPMRERSTGEMKGGGYRAATFYSCQFGEHVTLALLFSHFLYRKHTHNQLWKYFSVAKCPGASKATGFPPVGGRSEEKSALYLFNWQTSLKSTGCLSPVKAASLLKYKHITRESEGQQYNRSFLPAQTEPIHSEQEPETWMPPVSFSPLQNPKIQGQERKGDSKVAVQWQGCWKDGEVTRRTFTTLRGWWGHRGGKMGMSIYTEGVFFLPI